MPALCCLTDNSNSSPPSARCTKTMASRSCGTASSGMPSSPSVSACMILHTLSRTFTGISSSRTSTRSTPRSALFTKAFTRSIWVSDPAIISIMTRFSTSSSWRSLKEICSIPIPATSARAMGANAECPYRCAVARNNILPVVMRLTSAVGPVRDLPFTKVISASGLSCSRIKSTRGALLGYEVSVSRAIPQDATLTL